MSPYIEERRQMDDLHAVPCKADDKKEHRLHNESALLHRNIDQRPPIAVSSDGLILTLADGTHVVDACGGAAVAILGHSNPEVIAAATEQMSRSSYFHTGTYTTEAAEILASTILGGNPYGLRKALFVGSGSEAMDAAMKVARQYYFETGQLGRRNYVSRRQSYHGVTIGAMSVSSNLPRKVPYEPLLLSNCSFVSPAYAYQYMLGSETEDDYVARLTKELEEHLQSLDTQTVIAVICEPVVGATSGCTPAPKGYFRAVRAICDKYGILLIADEVMCGMGRTGSYFAFEQEDFTPDLVTIGKGLGSGYASIAGLLIGEKVLKGLASGSGSFNHFQTYQAHPLNCAMALKVQQIVKRDKLVENCAAMGKVLGQKLHHALQEKQYVGNIRGRGLFWGIEFVRDRATKASFDPKLEFGGRVQRKALEMGVAIYPGFATVDGKRGDHVLLAPPYIVTEADLAYMVEITTKAYMIVETELNESHA